MPKPGKWPTLSLQRRRARCLLRPWQIRRPKHIFKVAGKVQLPQRMYPNSHNVRTCPSLFLHLQNLVELAAIPGDLVLEAPHRNPSSLPGPSPRAGGLEMTSTFQLPIQWNSCHQLPRSKSQDGARLTNSGRGTTLLTPIFDGSLSAGRENSNPPPLINNPRLLINCPSSGPPPVQGPGSFTENFESANSRADRTGMIKQQSLDLA
jgi:hypothetical protein